MNDITGVIGFRRTLNVCNGSEKGGCQSGTEQGIQTKDVLQGEDQNLCKDTDPTPSPWISESGRGQVGIADGDLALLDQCLKRMEQKKEELQKKTDRERQKWMVTKKLSYSPGKHMMRLARLYQVTDVRKLISGVNANIYLAKSDKMINKTEVKTAVVQMQQVIQRARVKIKNLEQEAIEASIGKSAAKRRETEKARAIVQELKRKMVARKAREYGEARAAYCPRDVIGTGKTPQERWEETFQKLPGELIAPTTTPMPQEALIEQCGPQTVIIAQEVVASNSEISMTVDVYV